jgi:predicted NUDIX family phosphoesterase
MEEVLGVDRDLIEHLLTTDFGYIDTKEGYDLIRLNLRPIDRALAESDNSFKQVIPYLVVQYENELLLYKRTKKQSETRLHEKLSIGIGGHINPIDSTPVSDTIIECLKRELEEEVSIELMSEPEFMGFINDDTTEVGRVHLGLVFKGVAARKSFTVNEMEKMKCEWVSMKFIKENYQSLETWSQIVFISLITQQ